MRSLGLPEVRERDGFIDAGTLGSGKDVLPEELIRDALRYDDLTPERSVAIAVVREVGKPSVQVLDARDERHSPLAGLSVNGDFQAVAAIRDVADREIGDLAPTGLESHATVMSATLRGFRVASTIGRTSASQSSMSPESGIGL